MTVASSLQIIHHGSSSCKAYITKLLPVLKTDKLLWKIRGLSELRTVYRYFGVQFWMREAAVMVIFWGFQVIIHEIQVVSTVPIKTTITWPISGMFAKLQTCSYQLHHVCSTWSPFLTWLSRCAQSGRWSFFGKWVWFTESNIVLVISFLLFV